MSRRAAASILVLTVVVATAIGACSTAPLDVGSSDTSPTSVPLPDGPRTARLPSADPIPVSPTPTPQLPVTVTTADNRRVTITDVSRIVALDRYGTYGTAVFALGLGRNLVGRDIATKFPAAASIPVVTTGGTDANAEAIIALRPTVVLTDASLPSANVLTGQLTAAGIPVVTGSAGRTVAGTDAQLRAVATALGIPAAGDALVARTDSQIAAARAMVPRDADRPRIAFVYARGTGLLILGGPGSGADSLIDTVGGQDAGTAAGLTDAFTSLTSEGLIKSRPDVLLMMTDGLASVGGVDGLEKIPGVSETPAGRDRRIIDMDDGELLSFGARTGDVAVALARTLFGRP
ncbi:ABC transporter substrate-binding protein [Williamsia herbipolensis]|uniref:ABC transporter substrate-binding protein n=1 Tax=Williamsia herbipolensis TaxID=1603258 RepID=A0AAU4K622_9NOCA|nr:ABC transporter substrate-binding protein [Williamsia herbipolensis]